MGTTPPFMPGQIPGIQGGGGAVPGLPETTPQQDPANPVNDRTKQMLTALIQATQKKQMANTAVPGAVPAGGDVAAARNIGMNTQWPSAWGFQRFAATLGANVKNAVAKQKQDQLLKAEGDWSYLQSSMNELFDAQQSGDQKAIAAAQAKVDVTMHDPKKLKNMAKALNQDWLNPEKTTVYGEALKNVTGKVKQKEQEGQQKQQAAHGLKEMFQKLLGQKQQLQLTVEQQKKMAEEIQAKAPITKTGDKEAASLLREQMRDEAKSAEDQRKEAAKVAEDERKEAAKAKEAEVKADRDRETLEMKEKFQKQRDATQNSFHETMERMRETAAENRASAHDMKMMKMLGMKLDAQQEKLFKPDPSKLNKEVTDSVTSLRQQLAQASSAIKSMKTSATNHWLMGPGKSEIKDAEDSQKSLEKAIAHIEKNRDAIVHGKAELGDVISKAYEIMGGTDDNAAPPPPVPGAVVTPAGK